ncbi:MAG: GBS Bsp-like repeat-containing protein [Christensenella sp.]|nr:GBS Bsp-like repeat-containing protein [Christensenella sp.]
MKRIYGRNCIVFLLVLIIILSMSITALAEGGVSAEPSSEVSAQSSAEVPEQPSAEVPEQPSAEVSGESSAEVFEQPSAAEEPRVGDENAVAYEEGEVLVVFEEDSTALQAMNVIEENSAIADVEVTENEIHNDEVFLLKTDEGTSVMETVEELNNNPAVKLAQPNYIYQLMEGEEDYITQTSTINDPYQNKQWHLSSIGLFDAWDISKTNKTVKVAVLDTGVDMTHPDLTGVIDTANAYDEYNNCDLSLTGDIAGHGTHVAGIIAAQTNNGIGVSGVSYNASIVPINVFYATESGAYANTSTIVDAYDRIMNISGLKVINMSLGGYGSADNLLEQRINTAANKGILTVCAGGNGDSNGVAHDWAVYPSDFEACVSVVPLDSSNVRPSWADYNNNKDISAPGISIYSTYKGGSYGGMSGSSMASPVVAGVAALLYAKDLTLTVNEIKNILYSTATDLGTSGKDSYYGWGKINADSALLALNGERVKSISINVAASIELGQEINLQATVLPESAVNKDLAWSVESSGGRAEILNNSILIGKAQGNVRLCAKATDGSNVTTYKTIMIKDTTAPTASSVLAPIKVVYGTSYEVYAMNVQDAGNVAKVEFAVWSKADQSDIKWYSGSDFKNGNWGITANIANHNKNYGTYNVHVYATDGSGNRGFIGATTVNVLKDTVAPTARSITAPEQETYGTTFLVNAMNVSDDHSGVVKVEFAVWSKADQSDIKWYSGSDFKNGNWGITANIVNHKNNTGTYNIHVYATDGSGNRGFIGATTVNVLKDTTPPTASSITPSVRSTYGSMFEAYAINVHDARSDVAKVEFAVWSKADQSDIKWYSGSDFKNGNWGITANIANHNKNYGTYNVHVYATDGSGNRGFIGATTVNILKDTTPPTVASITPAVRETGGNTFEVYAINAKDAQSGIQNIRFAVWSAPNQSDIKWYSGSDFKNGNWGITADIANHNNNRGTYNIHVYAVNGQGVQGFVGATTVSVK